jgi:hypothetical protein
MKKKFLTIIFSLLFLFGISVTKADATDLRCDPLSANSTATCTKFFGKPATCQPDNRDSSITLTHTLQGTCVVNAENKTEPTIVLPQNGFSFDSLNPLNPAINGSTDPNAPTFRTPADIINRAVKLYAFPAAGLILFVMLVWGGFEMVLNASSSKSQDAGKQRITAAVIGFVILFSAYWIIQLLQAIFGIKVF